MRYLALLVGLLPFAWLADAQAQDGSATLSWTPPTENTDWSPLTDLAAFRVYWGASPGVYSNSETIPNPGVSTYIVEGLAPATWYFVVTAINAEGTESEPSNVASKTIQGASTTPNPPSGLTVQEEDLTAWTVVTTDGAIVALEVGSVPPGTACDPSQYVKPFGRDETLYRVPETAVAYLPGQTALVVFASCSGG